MGVGPGNDTPSTYQKQRGREGGWRRWLVAAVLMVVAQGERARERESERKKIERETKWGVGDGYS